MRVFTETTQERADVLVSLGQPVYMSWQADLDGINEFAGANRSVPYRGENPYGWHLYSTMRYKLILISRDEYLTLGRAGVWVAASSRLQNEYSTLQYVTSDAVRFTGIWEDTEGYPFLYTRVEVSDGSDA